VEKICKFLAALMARYLHSKQGFFFWLSGARLHQKKEIWLKKVIKNAKKLDEIAKQL